jgi:ubiquinone biosynthesis protein UbiJ
MKTTAKNFLTSTVQKALNTYLALDPDSKLRLAALQGQVVTVELLAVGIIFHLTFSASGIELQTGPIEHADTVIKGTPLRLLHLALAPRQNRQQFFADDVAIEGNLELGQLVIDLFDHIEVDWEEILSRFIGDVSAHHIGQIGKKFQSMFTRTRDILTQDVSEYLHEEIDFFPPREALSDFFHDVDEIRMDTDRLEARINHVENTLIVKRSLK